MSKHFSLFGVIVIAALVIVGLPLAVYYANVRADEAIFSELSIQIMECRTMQGIPILQPYKQSWRMGACLMRP